MLDKELLTLASSLDYSTRALENPYESLTGSWCARSSLFSWRHRDGFTNHGQSCAAIQPQIFAAVFDTVDRSIFRPDLPKKINLRSGDLGL